MFAVETETAFSVNRRSLADFLPVEDPVFTAGPVITTSETSAVYVFSTYQVFTSSGTTAQYGVICGNNPVNFVDPFGLLPKEQWDALNRILALERELGTHETARLISNTWGKDNVLQPFNADTGHNSHVNGVDIDWFTDLSSVNDANFPVITTAAYIAGKSGWSIMRRLSGDPNGNPFPFQDPGERAAVLKAELGRKYSDIITPAYMEKERPKNCK